MEPHFEKKGRLGGKFEEFSHAPRESVWDRIAAQPNDRPLGALFGVFAWPPKPQVWRRIAGELYPVPYFRIAAWTSAAAAAVAMVLLFAWNSQDGTPKPGKSFANARDLQLEANEGNSGNLAAMEAGNPAMNPSQAADFVDPSVQKHFPISKGSAHSAKNGKHSAGGDSANLQPDRSLATNDGQYATANGLPNKNAIMPWVDRGLSMLAPRSMVSIAPNLATIDQRSAFLKMLENDIQQEARWAREDAIQQFALLQQQPDVPKLTAQAGANLTTGGTGTYTGNRLADAFFTSSNAEPELTALRDEPQETYQTPLVIGALVDHRVVPRVAVGGGLVYTHLRSSYEDIVSNASQRLEISRQYLGLAAHATYSLDLSKKPGKLAMYGTAGIQYDFGLVKETKTSNTAFGMLSNSTEKTGLGDQVSLNGGIGMRYAILKRISLYAQGTGAHYFYAQDANLFTEKAVWPSGQIGLRLAL